MQIGANLERWTEVLESDRPNRRYFMPVSDQRALKLLPQTVTAYRGCTKENENGLSYSLSEEKAKWFANRFNKGGHVIKRVIRKSDIFAYLRGRNEDEIITLKTN